MLKDDGNRRSTKRRVTFTAKRTTRNRSPPLPASTGDPTLGSATLEVYNAAGLTRTSPPPYPGQRLDRGSAQAPKG